MNLRFHLAKGLRTLYPPADRRSKDTIYGIALRCRTIYGVQDTIRSIVSEIQYETERFSISRLIASHWLAINSRTYSSAVGMPDAKV